MNVRATRFPLFDSIRALAALSVIGLHGAFATGLYDNEFLRQFTSRLDVGVTIFFVVSGFLLYRPFVRARVEGGDWPSTGAYAWRRFLRIVPAYWVALTVIALVQLEHSEVFSLSGVLTYYPFAQVYQPGTAFKGIPQAWTLCVEVGFYVLLPLWALGMRRIRSPSPERRIRSELVALGLLALASLVYKAVLVQHGAIVEPEFGPFMLSVPAFLDQFAIGMALAVLSVWYTGRDERPAPLRAIERVPGLAWAGAALAFIAVSTFIGLDGSFGELLTGPQFFGRHLLYAAVALGVVLPAVFGDPEVGLVRRVLANRVLLYVGLISYGTYLWHAAVFEQLQRWDFAAVADATHPLAWYVAGTGLTIAVASVSYCLIERPALKLKDQIGGRAPGQRGEALTEPAPVLPRETGAG